MPGWPLFAAFGLLAVLLCLWCTGVAVWDDAYIFWRYAAHGISVGRWSWNPAAEASYGVTSPAWTALLSLPALALEAPLGLWLSSLACGVGVLLLLWRLSRASRWMLTFLLLSNALPLAIHFTSGMDTALVMVYQLLWLQLLSRRGSHWILGLLAGFGWWVRPEVAALLLVSLGVAALRERKWAGLALGLVSLGMALLACWWGFGSALPLPFFSKAGAHSDPGIQELYAFEGLIEGGLFLLAQLPLVLALLHSRKAALATLHLWLPALLLCGFYAFGTTQIMGMHQRFYYHAWPLLATAGFTALPDSLLPRAVRRWLPWASLLCCLTLAVSAGKPSNLLARWGQFDLQQVYVLQGGEANWPMLAQAQQLPDEVAFATSELGMVGVWNLQRPIVDLSSLTDPAQLSSAQLADRVLLQDQPHVIWLHPHYSGQLAAFVSHSAFLQHYEWIPPGTGGCYQGVALRKSSPHFHSLKAALAPYLLVP